MISEDKPITATAKKGEVGTITYDVECNPLQGPLVQTVIEQIENGENPMKFTYVPETAFDISDLSQQLIESRGY